MFPKSFSVTFPKILFATCPCALANYCEKEKEKKPSMQLSNVCKVPLITNDFQRSLTHVQGVVERAWHFQWGRNRFHRIYSHFPIYVVTF